MLHGTDDLTAMPTISVTSMLSLVPTYLDANMTDGYAAPFPTSVQFPPRTWGRHPFSILPRSFMRTVVPNTSRTQEA